MKQLSNSGTKQFVRLDAKTVCAYLYNTEELPDHDVQTGAQPRDLRLTNPDVAAKIETGLCRRPWQLCLEGGGGAKETVWNNKQLAN